MKDCTTCKYGFVDEQLGFPMCHHPKRFSEDCVDFNMHEEKEIKTEQSDSSEVPKDLVIEHNIHEKKVNEMLAKIDKEVLSKLLEKKPTNQDGLEEAAEESWAEYEYREHPQGLYASCYQDGFKAGAQWRDAQGVNHELEVKADAGGYPYIDKTFELYDYTEEKNIFNPGDIVIVNIRKK